MKPVTIYTRSTCIYCHAAKRLLNQKQADFTEIDIDRDPELRAEMIQKANGRSTVPQIWIGDIHVGGFDDIDRLEARGRLDAMLEG